MPDNSAQAAPAQVKSAASDAVERDLLLARDAFERRDLKALAPLREAFRARNHRLSHYVEYWSLSAALAQSPAAAETEAPALTRFLADQANSPLADGLRKEWLRSLGRQDKWDRFQAELPRINVDDPEIACHSWRHRLSQSDRGVDSEIRAAWNAGKPLPDACYDLFEAARRQVAVSTEEQWGRVRRLLDDNQLADARRSAAFIDSLPGTFERHTASIGLQAGAWLDKEPLNPKSRASIELHLFAIQRVARADAARGALLLEKHGRALPVADRLHAFGQIALQGALQHDTNTLDWYRAAEPLALNESQLAWKVRAALRAGAWEVVRKAIGDMEPAVRREPVWRYWLARAEDHLGNAPAAIALRESLLRDLAAREGTFYALLAAEETGTVVTPAWKGWRPTETDIAAMAAREGIIRAVALYRLDLKNEGFREWQFATRGFDDTALLTAAEVARRNAIPDRAISAADRTLAVHDYAQRYPMPHRDELATQARNWGLDEAWVYGLIRQESRFVADARSRVGAAGLMQLMPATARWAAVRVGLPPAAVKKLQEVPVNLVLGTFYLKHVLEDLGHPVLATAAYNAGPGRARRWRADKSLEGAIYAETIPFNETRDYVKKVMANTWYYTQQGGNTRVSLREMLGRVPGKSGGESGRSSLANLAALQ